MTDIDRQNRDDAIIARLRYMAATAGGQPVESRYTLRSGKVIDFGKQRGKWKLSRVLYRVGELRIKEARPALLGVRNLLATRMDGLCFVRTLGIIGSEADLPLLDDLERRFSYRPLIGRYIQQARLQLSGKVDVKGQDLPAVLRQLLAPASAPTADQLKEQLDRYTRPDQRNDYLYPLYLHLHAYHPGLLPTLRAHLATFPHQGNYWRPLRYILKAAEQLRDDVTLAQLTYWVWDGQPISHIWTRYDYKEINGRWRSVKRGQAAYVEGEEVPWRSTATPSEKSAGQNTKWGFTDKTRQYLLRRLFRSLKMAGKNENASYVTRATELLLRFNGRELKPAYDETFGRYARNPETNRYEYSTYKVYHPAGADLVPVHWIINGRREDYTMRPDALQGSSRREIREASGRQERFAKLWDDRPREVIRLIGASTLPMVLDFAIRIFRANPSFIAELTSADVLRWLQQDHTPVWRLAQTTLPQSPELVDDDDVAYAIITHADDQVRNVLTNLVKLSFPAIFNRLLNERDNRRFERGLRWTESVHGAQLYALHQEQLRPLTVHPLEVANRLAASILERMSPMPYALVLNLMTSEHAAIRARGIELFGRLPLAELNARHRETIVGMIVAEQDEVRAAALPVARRLSGAYADFGRELTTRLAAFLSLRGKATPEQETIADLLEGDDFAEHLTVLPEATVWQLLRSLKYPAQRVGYAALRQRVPADGFPTVTLVELGRHDLVDVRVFAREQLTARAERTIYDVLDFIRLVDTDWTDSSDFAKDFLRERMQPRDWTPEVLIHLLDIPREEVQEFTLAFVDQHVDERDASDFLLRASQHPGRRVQAFAAGWLERYASGKPELIEELLPFFRTLLEQISRGRLAKDRVFDFLERESLNDEATARLVLPLLERLVLTIAVGDRARCLVLLNTLRRRYPHLSTPLRPVMPPSRQPVSASSDGI